METKDVIKYAAIGVGLYLLYEWLQSSGYWAQWFGGAAANSFTNPASLLTYCTANPTGTATYVQTNGQSSTATCAQWLAANPSSAAASSVVGLPPTPPVTTVTPPAQPSNYQTAIAQMQAAAGNDSQNLDGWAYYWQNGAPFSGSPMGYGTSGSISPQQMSEIQGYNGNNPTAMVSAEQFVSWLNQSSASGVSGLGSFGSIAYGNAYEG